MTCDHEAVKRDPVAWQALPHVGVMEFEDMRMELRNCAHCMSTLAIDLNEKCDEQREAA
jgi:hypothetical protein